jgi:cell wall-associated NlpC family hydrolase
MSQSLREAILIEARSWVGTPYMDGQAVKGAGVDCAMLCIRAAADSGAFLFEDPRPYNSQFFLHTDDEIFLDYFLAHGVKVETPRVGDIAFFKMGRAYAHAGIISALEPLRIIHAMNAYKRVVEEEVAKMPSSMLRDYKAPPIFVDVVGDP